MVKFSKNTLSDFVSMTISISGLSINSDFERCNFWHLDLSLALLAFRLYECKINILSQQREH